MMPDLCLEQGKVETSEAGIISYWPRLEKDEFRRVLHTKFGNSTRKIGDLIEDRLPHYALEGKEEINLFHDGHFFIDRDSSDTINLAYFYFPENTSARIHTLSGFESMVEIMPMREKELIMIFA